MTISRHRSHSIRGLLTQIHPAPERVLGPRLDHPAVLDLLKRYPSPADLATVSEKALANRLIKLAPRMGRNLVSDIVQALSEQVVVVPTIVLPRLAQQLTAFPVLLSNSPLCASNARKLPAKLNAWCMHTLFGRS